MLENMAARAAANVLPRVRGGWEYFKNFGEGAATMSGMRKTVMTGLGVCAVFLTVACACAQPPGPPPGAGDGREDARREKEFDAIFEKLGLSPDQVARIRAIRAEERKTVRETFEKMRAGHEQLRAELEKPVSDPARVSALLDGIEPVMNSLFRLRIKNILAVKGVLTPGQFVRLQQEMENKHREHMRHMRPDQMPPPPPDGLGIFGGPEGPERKPGDMPPPSSGQAASGAGETQRKGGESMT